MLSILDVGVLWRGQQEREDRDDGQCESHREDRDDGQCESHREDRDDGQRESHREDRDDGQCESHREDRDDGQREAHLSVRLVVVRVKEEVRTVDARVDILVCFAETAQLSHPSRDQLPNKRSAKRSNNGRRTRGASCRIFS